MKGFSLKRIIVILIKSYQLLVSPWFPPVCRYYPTCSSYFLEAVERYGAAKGSLLGIKRILRCHPFHWGGYDPVP